MDERDTRIEALERQMSYVSTTANEQFTLLKKRIEQLQAALASTPKASTDSPVHLENVWVTRARKIEAKKGEVTSPKTSQIQVDMTNEILAEQAERNKRKNKIIVFGLTQSGAANEDERKKEDEASVRKLISDIKCNANEVKSVHRFKPRAIDKTPPPIIVTLVDEYARSGILRSTKMLKDIPAYARKVYINPDRTEAERISAKQARERTRLARDVAMDTAAEAAEVVASK